MKLAEVREFTNIASWIAALLSFAPELDENHRARRPSHHSHLATKEVSGLARVSTPPT